MLARVPKSAAVTQLSRAFAMTTVANTFIGDGGSTTFKTFTLFSLFSIWSSTYPFVSLKSLLRRRLLSETFCKIKILFGLMGSKTKKVAIFF